MAVNLLALAEHVQRQGEIGRQRGTEQRLNRLAGQAFGATPDQRAPIMQQMVETSPNEAFALQDRFQKQDDQRGSRLAGAAKYLLNAWEAKGPDGQRNEAAIQGAYRVVRPEFEALANGKPLPDVVDDSILPMLHQAIAAHEGGAGKGDMVQSTRIGADGFYYTVDRSGQWTNSGIKADPRTQLRDQPGIAPGIVDLRTGTVAPLADGAQSPQKAMPQGPSVQAHADMVASAAEQMRAAGVPTAQIDAWVSQQTGSVPWQDDEPATSQPAAQPGVAAPRPAVSPAEAQRLELARQANARAEEANQRAAESARLAQRGNAPAGFRFKADGTLEPIPGGPKPAGSAATEGERKAAVLLQRLNGSLTQLEAAVKANPDADSPSVAAEMGRALPFVGEAAANAINSPERQRVEAAQLDILDAALTLGTGAAYTREQLEGYRRSFFPQIADSDATIRDKAARLQNVIQAARIAAGRAAPAAGDTAAPARPQSQSDYDRLPSGAMFIDPDDGKTYRKP